MTPSDAGLAIAGGLAHAVAARVGSRRATWAVIIGLLVLSAIPILLISTTPRPTNLTFEDMSVERIPANTSWGRLVGDLRIVDTASGPQYELHDPTRDSWYVIVHSDVPLPAGPTMVTGHVSPHRATTGNIGTITADVPAVPPVDEPIWLYLTPAVVAIVTVIGIRVGYPVVRRDRATVSTTEPLAAGESLAGRWSGRVGSTIIAHDRAMPCSIAVEAVPGLPDMADIAIGVDAGVRTVRVRRSAPIRRVRLCRIGGSVAGLEVHAATADVVLAFPDRIGRDRFAATLR
jgi:hypothetical protein